MEMDSTTIVTQPPESDQEYFYTLLVTGIQQTIAIFGLIFNCSLVYLTAKHKPLRTKTFGLLLAICSLGDALCELATFLATVLVILRRQISLLGCFWVQIHSLIGVINSMIILLYIGLDRLLAVAFPIWYRIMISRIGAIKVVLLLNMVSLGFISYAICLIYLYDSENNQIRVYCEPGDIAKGPGLLLINFAVIVSTLGAVLVYILIWLLLRCNIRGDEVQQSQSNQQHCPLQSTQRIFKSLAVILAIVFCCWLSNLGYFLIQMLVTDPITQFLLIRLVAQTATVSGSINAPVLYFCSTEYRTLMQKEFPVVPRILAFCKSLFCCQTTTSASTIANGPSGSAISSSQLTKMVVECRRPQQQRSTSNRVLPNGGGF